MIKFLVTSGGVVNGPINLVFDVYSKRSTAFIYSPNTSGTPGLIEQIKRALYDNQLSSETVMSVTGDFTISYQYLRGATIWGVSFSTNHQYMRVYYNFEAASSQSLVIGTTAGQTKLIATNTLSYSEKIIKIL